MNARPSCFGRETTVQALGKEWKISRRTLGILDDFTDWAASRLPDPLEVAEKAILRLQDKQRKVAMDFEAKKISSADAQHLINAYQEQADRYAKIAMDKATAYLAFDSAEMQSLVHSARGSARMLMLLLKEHQPDVDEDTAFAISQELGREGQSKAEAVANGSPPPGPQAP